MPKRINRIVAVLGAALAMSVTAFASAAEAQEAPAIPFWGRPFPYGYAWHAWQDDEQGCYVWRRIETRRGPRYVRYFVCQPPLRARY